MSDNKFLPILSNVIVTEPISEELLKTAGIFTNQVAMDTRILKYYYRLLPDNRILFGGRGAVWGKDAANKKYGLRLNLNKSVALHPQYAVARSELDHLVLS